MNRRVASPTLAEALLAGEWTRAGLTASARRALGRSRGMAAVLRDVLAAFPEPPLHRRDQLARRIASLPAFRPPPTVRAWPLAPPAMAPRFGVPALPATGDLAAWLGMDVPGLEALADVRNLSRLARDERLLHYRCRWEPKRTTGWRLIQAPKELLRGVQRRLLDDLLDPVPVHPAAHGFVRGRSVLTALAPHCGRRVVVRVDLAEYFPSITRARGRGLFRALGYPDRVAGLLTGLCTHAVPPGVLAAAPGDVSPRLRVPHLPQGAPSSPAIANLCAFGFDVRVAALAASVGAHYTRYADDLVLSGDDDFERQVDGVLPLLGAIALEEGFDVNWRKTRVMGRSRRQHALGLVLNERPAVRRSERERLEAILVNCARTSPAAQNRDAHPAFEAHLRGRVAWVAAVDPRHGAELAALLDAVDWSGASTVTDRG